MTLNVVVISTEDCVLIKNLYQLKGCGADRLAKEFLTEAGN